MKKIFSVFVFIFLISYSFGQDITTSQKLQDIAVLLGVTIHAPNDSMPLKSRKRLNYKIVNQQLLLLRAGELYKDKDFINSSFYIKQVRTRFKNNDLNNLKFICCR